jgi:hypothetical protein
MNWDDFDFLKELLVHLEEGGSLDLVDLQKAVLILTKDAVERARDAESGG